MVLLTFMNNQLGRTGGRIAVTIDRFGRVQTRIIFAAVFNVQLIIVAVHFLRRNTIGQTIV